MCMPMGKRVLALKDYIISRSDTWVSFDDLTRHFREKYREEVGESRLLTPMRDLLSTYTNVRCENKRIMWETELGRKRRELIKLDGDIRTYDRRIAEIERRMSMDAAQLAHLKACKEKVLEGAPDSYLSEYLGLNDRAAE